MIKLACTGCGAPLEITSALEIFACSYCGAVQRVERAGGIVALLKIEGAINAVQRGTDRTAAELAIPRLTQELAEQEATRKNILEMLAEKRASAVRGRKTLTIASLIAVFFAFPILSGIAESFSQGIATFALGITPIAMIVIPMFVYRTVKLPAIDSGFHTREVDLKIGKLKNQLAANRRILDRPLE